MATSILGQTAVRAAKLEVVTELPEIGKKNQIYLVPNKSSVSGDVYDEYIWINDTWEFLGNKRLELTIDSFLKPDSTNPVENSAIYWRFLGVDKDIEVNRNNIGTLTGKVNEVDGIAKGAEALVKINEERLNEVQATANTALENSERNQNQLTSVRVTANEAKASIENLKIVVNGAENNISQLRELNVVYSNKIRNLTTESTSAEIFHAFVPKIGGSIDVINTPHVGYLIKGNKNSDDQDNPDSTIISVEIVKIDNKDCHKFMYIDNNRDLVTMTVYLNNVNIITGHKLIERSVVSNIDTIINNINTFDKKLSSGTLRDLYISAGAKYNEATGFYELNGITDIDEKEMREIYSKYLIDSGTSMGASGWLSMGNRTIRTNLPSLTRAGIFNILSNSISSGKCIEVLNIGNGDSNSVCHVGGTEAVAHNLLPKLREVIGTWMYNDPKPNKYNFGYGQPFGKCPLLEEIKISGINKSHTFAESPRLSKASVLHMIANANPPSGAAVGSITITLHPTAYARLKDDADIVAALEAKRGIVTLVSA